MWTLPMNPHNQCGVDLLNYVMNVELTHKIHNKCGFELLKCIMSMELTN